MSPRRLSAVLAAALSAGCALHRVPVLRPAHDPVPLHGDRAALWKVGVVEPVLRAGDDQPRIAIAQIETAANLIDTLRRVDLFHEVDFARQLRCPVDVEVVALPAIDDFRFAPFWFQLLTLSVKADEHVAVWFHPASAYGEQIELSYDSGAWVGLAPLLLSPLALFGAMGEWTLADTSELRIRALRAQLLEKGGVLERHQGEAAGHCPEEP